MASNAFNDLVDADTGTGAYRRGQSAGDAVMLLGAFFTLGATSASSAPLVAERFIHTARATRTANAGNETAGALTSLGKAKELAPAYLDDFPAGQGFSGVFDEATGSILAFPSGIAGGVPRRGGHAIVEAPMTQAMGAGVQRRAGFTAILQQDGGLEIQWLSRSVNGRMGNPLVPVDLRAGILDAMSSLTGRTVRGQ